MTTPKKTFRRPIDFVDAAAEAPALPSASAVAVDEVPVAASRSPWSSAHPKMRVGFAMRLPEALHMKLSWLAEHIPNESMHGLALSAIEREVELLIAEHYK